MQSRLLKLKQEKNQSAQWTSEVKNHPAWLEFKAKDRGDQIDNLVLACFIFTQRPGGSSGVCYSTVSSLARLLLCSDYGLLDYPEFPDLGKYPNAIVCTCGNVLELGGTSWGLVKHCSSCMNPHTSRFWVEMFPSGIERTHMNVSKLWAEWAQVQAILLETKRKKLRSQTAIESLTSEKQND